MTQEEQSLTSDEMREFFEEFMKKLQVSARDSFASDMDISDYVNSMHMFSTYYDKLLQEYYSSVEFIAQMAKNKEQGLSQ